MEQRNEPSFPSLEDIPAMRAILEDKVMFKVFLSMLSSKTSDDSNIRSPSLGQIKTCARPVQSIPLQNVIATKQYQQQQQRNGRKRAFSSSSADDSLLMTPNKSMKMTKSPMQHGKDIFKLSALNVPTIPVLGVQGIPSSPDTNFSVLAAVIFYSVLRYVDQWPSIFLKLFAEDSFGPRIWADDERCQQFVKNLTLTLESSSKLTSVDVDVDADSFVSSFDSFIREDVAIQNGIENGNGSDSDSGDEEFVFEGATGGLPLPNNKLAGVPVTNAQTNDDSSSSGEELSSDEIVISVTSSSKNGNGEPRLKTVQDDAESESNVSAIQSHPLPCLDSNDKSQNRFSPIPSQSSQSQISQENVRPWWKCESVVTNQVCNRYFGHNKDIAFEMVGVALSLRLGEKVKQNSSLLATLPFFTRIPRVRSLATMQLEKWLQSPALSGLARKLFSTIVGRIENADPPLPEDISAIQSILSMSLKANQVRSFHLNRCVLFINDVISFLTIIHIYAPQQFHAHVENVIEIVKCVPTLSICRQIVLYLLREELDHSESDEVKTTNDNDGGLQMLKAVLQTIPQKLGHDVVASSLLILCMSNSVASLKHQITFLCSLLRKITGLVHNWYEGMTMVKSLLSHTDNHVSIEVTARLVLECMLLSVPSEMHDGTSVHQSIYESPLAPMMLAYKKMILKWALKAFDLRDEPKRDQFEAREPRTPVYDCILDGVSNFKPHQKDTKLLYCTLLLAGTNSDDFKTFLNKNQCAESDEQTAQVNSCILYGRVVDDEMIQMIIKAAKCKGSNIGNVSSIELVESLLFHCRKNTEGRLIFSDCQLVWDLYSLSEHNLKQLKLGKDIPRIACPGIWWRVTVISLIICGASPTRVGALMWDEHPTLRALMKMAVSKKFRFPPVDCDEKNREVMKADEYKMREEV
jgi:integrator complex subunit 1